MPRVDLNCDLGESFGAYTIGLDAEVIPHISSANVACGWHGGDPLVMQKTVALCRQNGVAVGAHPSYPDLLGFGRRAMGVTPDEARAYVKYQIGALRAFCQAEGLELQHVKPHGALYNAMGRDPKLAEAVCRGIKDCGGGLIVMALAGSAAVRAAQELGLPVAQEVFADRAYEEDGSLVDRRKEGAMITDEAEAIARVVRMVTEGKVAAITGKELSISAHSVCVHGDGPKALAFVKSIRAALQQAGVDVAPLREVL